MPDDLRTRIAKVLRDLLIREITESVNGVDNIYVGDDTIHLMPLAHAVIREVEIYRRLVSEDEFLDAILEDETADE